MMFLQNPDYKRHISYTMIAAILSFPASSVAYAGSSNAKFPLEKCEMFGSVNVREENYIVHSRSVVSFTSQRSNEVSDGRFLHYVHCRSGKILTIETLKADSEGQDDRSKYRQIIAALDGISFGREKHDFEDVLVAVSKLGADASIRIVPQEVCACRAAFPRHRGEKTPFVPADGSALELDSKSAKLSEESQ